LVTAIIVLGAVSCSSHTDRHSACSQISQVLGDVGQTLHRVTSGGATPTDVEPALAEEGGKLSSIARNSPGDLRSIGQRLSDDVAQVRVDLLEHHDSTSEVAATRLAASQLRSACTGN